MDKIWTIIKQDLRVFLKSRTNLISLLLTPAVMTIIIALIDSGAFAGNQVLIMDVIDADRSPASTQLLTQVRAANPDLTICPMDNTSKDICSLGSAALTEASALDRVAASTSLGLLEIPAGYGADLAAQQPVSVTFRATGSYGSAAEFARQAVQAALSNVNAAAAASRLGSSAIASITGAATSAQVQSDLYQQALQMQAAKLVSVDYSLTNVGEQLTMGQHLQQGLGQSVPGMGSMFAMMTIFGGMAALIVERQQWTLPRLASMPVRRSSLLAGKILARFSLGLLQFLVVFIIGAVFKMNFGKDPFALILLTALYCLAITAFAFAVGAGMKNPAQASGLGLLLTLTLSPLGGAWWPMDISPRYLQVIGHVSPVAWAMDGFTALTYRGATLVDIWLPLLVLAGMTVVLFLIAIPRFKYMVD